jgi:hypothetical protein
MRLLRGKARFGLTKVGLAGAENEIRFDQNEIRLMVSEGWLKASEIGSREEKIWSAVTCHRFGF